MGNVIKKIVGGIVIGVLFVVLRTSWHFLSSFK